MSISFSSRPPASSSSQPKEGSDPKLLEDLWQALQVWSQVWRLPRLPQQIRVEFSQRLRTSLGRCHMRSGLIRLNGILLLPQNRALLFETLCHEAAHVATFHLHGSKAKAHGGEWKALLKAAGFAPRATIDADRIAGLPRPRARRQTRYQYHCPICRILVEMRVRNSSYRCRACITAGRPGQLQIRRLH